ncbi:fungal-specific transcription factor domain-containing protein, partial [Lineolata rhizophorae]
DDSTKRRCVSTACIACRKRKSKCDGNTPACAACASVYNTPCHYDISTDRRRKGVWKKDIDSEQTKNSTLQTLIEAILNYPEDDVATLVRDIRTCESLDDVAESIMQKEKETEEAEEEELAAFNAAASSSTPTFETQLSGRMGELQLTEGSTRYIGGTSHLIHLNVEGEQEDPYDMVSSAGASEGFASPSHEDPVTSWTRVTKDPELIMHLLNMYFTWHYTYFVTLSKALFYRDFFQGKPPSGRRPYCSPLLVNAMLALGCHFTSRQGGRENKEDSATAGDHFFKEAKRLIMENDEHETPRVTTVQAFALMSVREAGCGREAKGWVYSGMAFRMALDLGLNLDSGTLTTRQGSDLVDEEEDLRRITFWGCFLFDKCWSNYLGRLPQLPTGIVTVPKFDVFPSEDAEIWAAYTDSGFSQAHAQPSRVRAVSLQISRLCEISSDIMLSFYNPIDYERVKGKQAELKKLSEIYQRLEAWKRELPKELEPREGGLPSMLVMHMFFQLHFIHLFRPFLKYNESSSPLPSNVSPRKICTQAAATISKLLRLYKRSHGLRQICNIAVYIAHSACTIHLLNLPEKNARRDIIHGVKHLEEIAEGWLCARRTLCILSLLARKWRVDLPEEAATVLARTDAKFGPSYQESIQARPPNQQPQHHQHQPQPQHHQHQHQRLGPSHLAAAAAAAPQPLHHIAPSASGFPVAADFPANRPAAPSYSASASASTAAAAAAAAARRGSETTSLPPDSAAALGMARAQRRAASGPSDLFGGVDALLRESTDWWLRDQSQLAAGFDNWDMGECDAAAWAEGL